jgi:hypothetical protein
MHNAAAANAAALVCTSMSWRQTDVARRSEIRLLKPANYLLWGASIACAEWFWKHESGTYSRVKDQF